MGVISNIRNEEHYTIESQGLHIHEDSSGWAVWLNTEVQDFDGLCIGCGESRQEAVAQAVKTLEAVVEQLQQPLTDDEQQAGDEGESK